MSDATQARVIGQNPRPIDGPGPTSHSAHDVKQLIMAYHGAWRQREQYSTLCSHLRAEFDIALTARVTLNNTQENGSFAHLPARQDVYASADLLKRRTSIFSWTSNQA